MKLDLLNQQMLHSQLTVRHSGKGWRGDSASVSQQQQRRASPMLAPNASEQDNHMLAFMVEEDR